MNKEKVIGLIEGILFIVFGVLVAINGGISTTDLYLGIVGVIAGSLLILLSLALYFKTRQMAFGPLAAGGVALVVGGGLLANDLTIAAIIYFLLFALMGLGGALIVYGIYAITKKAPLFGAAQVVIGAAFIVLPLCYLHVDGFDKAFWITVGVMMIVYGVLFIISLFVNNKALTKK